MGGEARSAAMEGAALAAAEGGTGTSGSDLMNFSSFFPRRRQRRSDDGGGDEIALARLRDSTLRTRSLAPPFPFFEALRGSLSKLLLPKCVPLLAACTRALLLRALLLPLHPVTAGSRDVPNRVALKPLPYEMRGRLELICGPMFSGKRRV